MSEKYYYYMFVIAVFFNGLLPIAEYLLWQQQFTMNGSLRVGWLCTNIVLYPCLGYFLQNKFDLEKHKRKIPLLWVVNILTILLSCFMTYQKALITGECNEGVSQAFHNSFVLINSVTIFITAKWFFGKYKIPEVLKKVILSVGSCTFGIYLFHVLFLKYFPPFQKLWAFLGETLGINQMAATVLICLLVMLAGLSCDAGSEKNPPFEKACQLS